MSATPSPAGVDRRKARFALGGLVILALILRLTGLGFGLPDAHHAYPYNPDEWTPMQVLKNMDPGRLDFNPRYFFNPTFHYYLYGAGFAALHLVGAVNVRGDERFYFAHPEHLARMIGMGRLYSALLGAATVWLVYRLARRIGLGRGPSLLAAALLAMHPSHVIHCHFMTVNAAVTFWCTLAILGLVRWAGRGGIRPAILAGLAVGLACSTKYSAFLLLPLAAWSGLIRFGTTKSARVIGEGALIGLAAGAAFLAGSPYALLAFADFRQGFREMSSYLDEAGGSVSALTGWLRAARVHLWASTPPLLVAGLAGLIPLAQRGFRPGGWIVGAWLLAFLASTFTAGALASDSRFLPLYPALVVSAALSLSWLWRRGAAGRAMTGATVILLAGTTLLLLGRFVGEMPQQAASNWMRASVPDSASVRLSGSAIYYFPDLPLREFLARDNAGAYPRTTGWRFVEGKGYATARAARPDFVVLTVWLPRKPAEMEWLTDPDYKVVATFPGKVNLLGKRLRLPLDLYDTDTWILRRRS